MRRSYPSTIPMSNMLVLVEKAFDVLEYLEGCHVAEHLIAALVHTDIAKLVAHQLKVCESENDILDLIHRT